MCVKMFDKLFCTAEKTIDRLLVIFSSMEHWNGKLTIITSVTRRFLRTHNFKVLKRQGQLQRTQCRTIMASNMFFLHLYIFQGSVDIFSLENVLRKAIFFSFLGFPKSTERFAAGRNAIRGICQNKLCANCCSSWIECFQVPLYMQFL